MNGVVDRIKVAQPQTHLSSTFLGCLTAMTDGDVSAITGDHWANALRSGGLTAAIATVVAAFGLRVNNWTRAALCGVATFGVEMIAQSPTYGTSRADIAQTSLVAAGIATVLALVAGRMFSKYLPVAEDNPGWDRA
jgi:hypothetical protein